MKNKLPRLTHAETVSDSDLDSWGRPREIRLEKKHVRLVPAIVFTLPNRALAFDPCDGTGPASMAHLLQSKHRPFGDCEPDRCCYELMLPSLSLISATRALIEEFDIIGGPAVQAAARMYSSATTQLAAA